MEQPLNVARNIQPLIAAVEDGDLPKVQKLLEQNISVETTDDNGNSLLHIAAANGHEDVVRYLSMKGASLDRTNLYGWTPLMQAARYGHEDVALHLLNNKAKINSITPLGVTALTLAIYGGHSKMVDLLLSNSELVLDDAESISYFISPLVVSTMYGRDDALRLLLRQGVPPNQSFKSTEWTSLMVSALTGQLPMARLLVNKGANTNHKNKLGKTALEIATDCEKREVRSYLDRRTSVKPERIADKGDNIITAVKEGNYTKVAILLENDKSQANKSSPDGATPLMYASITGQLHMIDLLISSGADIDARDYENGWTALMQATYYGKTQAAIKLIKYGANVHIRTCNGVTAFDMAMLINLNDTKLFRLLAEKMMSETSSDVASSPPDSKQPTKAWMSGTGSSGSLMSDTSRSQSSNSNSGMTATNKRSLWSKVTRTMRAIKLTKSSKILPNKGIDNGFESTLIAPDNENDETQPYDTTGGNVTNISNPYSMTNHSAPTTHFPSDKLLPVIPPFQNSTGVDKQSMATQNKLSASKTSISNSLNSSGESSVSRSVVRPFKFLHSPNSSGRHNSATGNSPHSSGGATSVTRNFGHSHSRVPSGGMPEPHNRSGDRYSDTVLATMAKRRQRKNPTSPASVDGSLPRRGVTSEQLHKHRTSHSSSDLPHRQHAGSRASSVASSENTSSTLTPPKSHHSHSVPRSVSSRSSRSIKSGSESRRDPPSLNEEDELSLILRKLSLEKYHPIFEQQEIDMDAFLTLTQGDLSELGITQELPRQQILRAISQIVKDNESVSSGSNRDYPTVQSNQRSANGVSRSQWSYNQSTLRR